MRKLSVIIILIIFFGCQPTVKENPTSNSVSAPEVAEPAVKDASKPVASPDPHVAVSFINSYIKKQGKIDDEFIDNIGYATDAFKTAFTDMVKKAWEDDPVMGLNFDPVLNSQEAVEKEFVLEDFDQELGYVIVRNSEWEFVKVKLKIVTKNGQTLVDGAGVVNIPQSEQMDQ